MLFNDEPNVTHRGQVFLNGNQVDETVGVDDDVEYPIVTSARHYHLPPGKLIFGTFNSALKLSPPHFKAIMQVSTCT